MIRNTEVICYFIFAVRNGLFQPKIGIRANAGPGDGAETFRPYTLRFELFFNAPNMPYWGHRNFGFLTKRANDRKNELFLLILTLAANLTFGLLLDRAAVFCDRC
jgi:hypothetical protein